MIIIEDVFVVRHEVPDENYKEADGEGGVRQMTADEICAYENDLEIDGAVEAITLVTEENLHWSRKVRHVDG